MTFVRRAAGLDGVSEKLASDSEGEPRSRCSWRALAAPRRRSVPRTLRRPDPRPPAPPVVLRERFACLGLDLATRLFLDPLGPAARGRAGPDWDYAARGLLLRARLAYSVSRHHRTPGHGVARCRRLGGVEPLPRLSGS